MSILTRFFPCKISEVRFDKTLACGQSFRWHEDKEGRWIGVIGNAVWKLWQTNTHIYYQTFRANEMMTDVKPIIAEDCSTKIECTSCIHQTIDYTAFCCCPDRDEAILRNYLNLHINLEELYKTWSDADEHFKDIAQKFTGIRMLRQPPVECLFSFICSSNNHISRIGGMVEKLTVNFGEKIANVDGMDYFTFPKVSRLAAVGVEDQLRKLGFGYRAKYIQKSAEFIISNGGEDWLYVLRDLPYKESKTSLMQLCGVGAKVADCVALMCLDKPGSIPVDTHVWQIAARDYMPKLAQAKSLTDKLYEEIGEHFRNLWGPYAGWAHSVLFAADLRKFKEPNTVKKTSPIKRKQTVGEPKRLEIKEEKKAKVLDVVEQTGDTINQTEGKPSLRQRRVKK
ncbi:N-glycosylase/DNA lyase-like [Dreissena polymorpha]|uniref:N-glycosylase/DNA lyase n=1 Tax=Dreissena polymorpha TaxID=45954 RepID=A0A9D4J0W8_DREPO|nr:N-glycosylase/DNA lyase-like [Dreissena polymorpha]KAH3791613.1 hypothetical protein DPMN_145101 [Dreissena polymorpha]